ncbi:heme exporter protein D [Shimia isoporae]|uniref:Heme exporter protein D n=1 Tax=Shimia isoporae TaxID=647720 RepID=A0A4V2Q3Z6_9RHOB|nr:heme exporter protein CcmD [Shimia isoporae]TCL09120.1 heme exporter protein D [Shimia isoporae]
MPDLGKYAAEVLSAYGVAIILVVSLVIGSLRSARRAQLELEAAEARRNDG